jgi:hypothetical protein
LSQREAKRLDAGVPNNSCGRTVRSSRVSLRPSRDSKQPRQITNFPSRNVVPSTTHSLTSSSGHTASHSSS